MRTEVLAMLLLSGCATSSFRDDLSSIEARTGHALDGIGAEVALGEDDDAEIDELLGAPLTADRAVAIGHPHVQRKAAFHLWRGRARDRTGDRRGALSDYRMALSLHADTGVHTAARSGHKKPWAGKGMNIDFSMGDVVQP